MKKTTLYNTHLNLNAKMTPFGGYEMPVQYSGVTKEHLAVRKGVGVFDVSHMGEFMVSGPKAFDLLQYICSNDISKISIGKAQYNYFPNETGIFGWWLSVAFKEHKQRVVVCFLMF